MPGTLPYAYMDACREVSWSAECTTCQKTVASRAQAQPHIAEQHTVIATCDQTPVRVLSYWGKSDIASKLVHRESNLMFTLSSDKDQRNKLGFAFAHFKRTFRHRVLDKLFSKPTMF